MVDRAHRATRGRQDGSVSSNFPLRASLNGLREKMLVNFREVTAQIEHWGAKGREREALIAREYLQHYVPRALEIIHGAEILDLEGNRSAECDRTWICSSGTHRRRASAQVYFSGPRC